MNSLMLIQQQGILQNRSIYHFDYPKVVIQIKSFLNLDHQIGISKLFMNEYINQPQRTNLFIYKEDENFDKFIVHDVYRYHFNNKIRWTYNGYQYDCNNRHYPQEKHKYLIQQEKYIESKQFLIIVKSLSD